jgi:molybdopterin-biosynthesis enzyme MoeA-like protein
MTASRIIVVALQQNRRESLAPTPEPSIQKEDSPMEATKITQQMIEFQKATFNNAFTALVVVQDQTEALFNSMISQIPGVPEEGKRMLKEWSDTYKQGRENFKKSVDEGFVKLSAYFSEAQEASAKKKI